MRTAAERLAERLEAFISGGRFPAFAISLLGLYELVLVGMLLAPGGPTGLGAFADELATLMPIAPATLNEPPEVLASGALAPEAFMPESVATVSACDTSPATAWSKV